VAVIVPVPAGLCIGRVVAVAPGHVQVPVDATQQRQVHLFNSVEGYL
jgi:hypothetical protein